MMAADSRKGNGQYETIAAPETQGRLISDLCLVGLLVVRGQRQCIWSKHALLIRIHSFQKKKSHCPCLTYWKMLELDVGQIKLGGKVVEYMYAKGTLPLSFSTQARVI